MTKERCYDLVLVGATGFTGRLTAKYLAAHAPPRLRWALSGRDQSKLAAIAATLAREWPDQSEPDIMVTDAGDEIALRAVAETSRVVVTTIGPYVSRGEPLVAACIAGGADYLDITGETEFVDRIWLDHHAEAERKGVRLVHCCGFIAIAEDLGAYFTVQHLPQDAPLKVNGHVRFRLRFSGGSYRSLIQSFARSRQRQVVARSRQAVEAEPSARKVYALPGKVRRNSYLGGWVTPDSSISAITVRRTAAVLPSYGPEFGYGHHLVFRRFSALSGFFLTATAAGVFLRLVPVRKLLLKMKKAGVGPDQTERDRSWFELIFIGEGAGRTVITKVTGGDPGYDETAKMLAESALCIAFDDLPRRSGQLTPALAMGDALMRRLRTAGISFQIVKTSTI
ncbi:MAG TPA: saccharopine dehydrogenase NADP-binding domain-containing protein [Opitutaceae bacterium]|jgi:saccharopine dehydrogenase (NAD+, L-glutamate forming)|nr:saccharopine dehydrogenase NADP-binding domain-containing protein [Opitutaceae bacterium]